MTARFPKLLLLCAVLALFATAARAQSAATAELHVTVKDPKGALIKDARVSVSNPARSLERALTANSDGEYQFLALPPGSYKVTVEAPGFSKSVADNVTVTVGQRAELPISLTVAAVESVVNVDTEPELVETQKTASTTTITSQRIDNLPINGRNYINFTLTDSKLARDNTPNIPVAPTSGLNFGGQRARANLVNVDGADAVDNSTNGIRATVSQEAVQEFQVITNNFAAEYGRASGGVVNIVTKSGTNDFHGSAYGFLRNRNIQAVNPFSNVPDPAYTRVQAGFAAGGPIRRDKTFFFFSYETTRRRETGFSNIGAHNFDLVPFNAGTLAPYLGGLNLGTLQLTSDQAAFVTKLASFVPSVPAYANALGGYLALAGAGSGVGVNGVLPTANILGVMTQAGIPTAGCLASNLHCFASSGAPIPGLGSSFFPLSSEIGNFPVTEGTSLISLRLDHRLSNTQQLMLRSNVSPSTQTGLEVSAQGTQNYGLNSYSRTSDLTNRDVAGVAQHVWTIGNNKINEFRFQYARRGQNYTYSHSLGGSAVGDQITGYAYIGREPFSFVRRTEQRYQFTDNFSISHGHHTFKFGGDFNYLPLNADFAVNFGGVYNFNPLSAGFASGGLIPDCIPSPAYAPHANCGDASHPNDLRTPSLTPVQTYGLGLPQTTIQGVGNPHDQLSNKTLGAFLQDTWHIRQNVTLNIGVRYDVEFTPTFTPVSSISAAAEKALGITEGIPRDFNNVAPRIGIAWDPWNDGKTVFRAAYGMFYDHPLLALAFDSDVADGSQAPQFPLLANSPGCGTSAATAVNAVNVFQGILAQCVALGQGGNPAFAGLDKLNYIASQQRFDPTPGAASAFTKQQFLSLNPPVPMTFLPDGFPVSSNFQYAYSNQASVAIERDLGHNLALSVEYNFNGGRHLNRPVDSNPTVPAAMAANFIRCQYDTNCTNASGTKSGGPLLAGLGAAPLPCGTIATNPVTTAAGVAGKVWVASPVMNFFRKGGANPSFAPLLATVWSPCAADVAALSSEFGLGVGVPVPFNAMGANYSNGSSVYHALSVNLRKRMSHHVEFLGSYTWSHAIDDSTDLETPLAVQDPFNPGADRSNSIFDQRHRFVFSGVYESGKVTGSSFRSKLLSDWTFAPIVDVASGRPFPVLSGSDTNFDSRSTNDRPNAVPANYTYSSPTVAQLCSYVPPPVASKYSPTGYLQPACFFDGTFGNGTLGRNAGRRPYTLFNDLRVARRFHLTERWKLDGIMDLFNIANKYNVADVNYIWNQAGQPTAAYDPRQFQFALKLSW